MIKIDISPAYIQLSNSAKDREVRGKLFKRYVAAYIDRNYPRYRFMKIEGMKAVCEKR